MQIPTESNGTFTWREVLFIIAMCLAIFLTRLPWISAGYGAEPDVYRTINAARHIAQTGEYIASRLPGHPVHEYLIAITSGKTSPLVSNGLTAVFSCIAFLFFALILRQFRIRQYLLLASAFAFTPVVYVNSTNTMDYMFAIAFVLGSTYFVLVHRPAVAGICLGLAIGCRITAGAMLVPLALLMFLEERTAASGKRFLILSVTTLMTSGICFLPVVHRYGLDFFTFADNAGDTSVSALLKKGVLDVWGVPATLSLLGLCCLVPFISQNIRMSLMQPHARRGLVLSSLVVVLYVMAWFRLPSKGAYLIPIVPFVLLSVGLFIPPNFVRWFAMILVLSSFFIMIDRKGVTLAGPIMRDHWTRQSQIQETEKIIKTVAHLPENAVIVAGWNLPQIETALSDEYKDNHEYVYSIEDADTYRRYVEQARAVYFLRDIDAYNLQQYGVDLRHLGAQQLDARDEQ
jgi:hypothetical protein